MNMRLSLLSHSLFLKKEIGYQSVFEIGGGVTQNRTEWFIHGRLSGDSAFDGV